VSHPNSPSDDEFAWQRPTSSSSGAPAEAEYTGYEVVPVSQHSAPARIPTTVVVAAKSPGIAALLSFLWLGGGHLYAGAVGVGVTLMLVDGFLLLLSLTGFGLFLTIPIWIIATPVAMIFAARAAGQFNQRNGILIR
jgi:hypothetical protein